MQYRFEMFKGFCVYLIENTISGTQYVGMTRDIKKRLSSHLSQARNNKTNSYLHHAIRKHGDDNFCVSILHRCDSHECAVALEMSEIASRGTQISGYNVTAGGDGVRSLRPEVMQRLSAAMSIAKSGVPLSDQHKAALSQSLSGRIFSESHRDNLSRAMTGRKVSQAACAAMSARRSGVPLSEAHRMSIASSLKGRKIDDFWRENIRAAAIASRGRSVLCVETGMIFDTLLDAKNWLMLNGHPKASPSAIGRTCRGSVPRAYGFKWKYNEVAK
ncbi:GIY-YIG catalytic domain protein [compost metagenome]